MNAFHFGILEILNYSNYDLTNIVSPVNVDIYEKLLFDCGYKKEKANFLVQSFRHGFPLHYKGNQEVQLTSPNLKFSTGDEVVLWYKVMKEVKLKRYAGPYDNIPFPHFIHSPIGLVPKDGGVNTCLIFHLSYPEQGKKSVNANIPAELCMVKYLDFTDSVRMCISEGVLSMTGKSDMSLAFCHLRMRIQDFCWLVMKAKNPVPKVWQYFVNKCLPFGSSISCAHFQKFSDSIAFLVKVKSHRKKKPLNYLDDFCLCCSKEGYM